MVTDRIAVSGGRAWKDVGMSELWHVELVNAERDERITRKADVAIRRDDEEAQRMWLIELAVEHAGERRDRVEEWISKYALNLCMGFSSTPVKRYRTVK